MKNSIKSKKATSLRVKLSRVSTFFLLFAIVIFSLISVYFVRSSSMNTAIIVGEEKLRDDMLLFQTMLSAKHGQLTLKNNVIVDEHGQSLNYNYEIVDKLTASIGVVATIFIKEGVNYRRISTSIVNAAGERAVDTFLDTNSAAYPSAQNGRDYSGNAEIIGKDYLTLYHPIYNADKKDVIGVLFLGTELSKTEELIAKNTVRQTTLMIIIAVTILLALIIANTLSLNYILVKPIRVVTDIIGKLSLGHINQEIRATDNKDEIGQMQNELGKLIAGLEHTVEFAQYVGKGHLDSEYNLLSDGDILGKSLLEMRQNLKEAEAENALNKKKEEQRNWVTAGLAKFAEILRQDNNNIEVLTYKVITNIVDYLGVNQGGIFILNEAEEERERMLELKACYAYDRQKFGKKIIRPGEGLVGACFLERKPVYITKVPDDYINITSGLGDANPTAILISPLIVNDEIFGVMELASFDTFEAYQLEFVEKVSESIAATISTVYVNIRTNKLLEKTKLQTEEMANAEEELRQTMEEMQATQEEMRRREDELNDTLEKMRKLQAG